MRNLAITAWAASLCIWTAGAQPATRKEPARYAGAEPASRVEVRPPGIRYGLRNPREFALAPLSGPEVALLAAPDPRVRSGVHRSLPPDALSAGAWETAPDGARVWRLALRSPGAKELRVEFRNFSVGSGRVWFYSGAQPAAPYSGRGLFGDGHFWSATAFSESAILEYEPESAAVSAATLPFEISTLSHHVSPVRRSSAVDPTAGAVDTADYCELDVACYPDWQSSKSSVGQLFFEDAGAAYLCSGSLVSTRDNSFKPYLLTAGHCINNEAAARTLEVFWTYQTPYCGGAAPASRDSSTKSTLGGHLIASGSIGQGDYSLVLLQNIPGGVTFAGWDPTDPPVGTALTGIHHPSGSWKRISFGERTTDADTQISGAGLAPAGLYLQVLWDQGRIEPGSSGSPLFSGPGVIVGTASFGPESDVLSACQIDPSVAGYARFSNTYQNLKDYFEDLPAVLVTPSRSNLAFTVANHATPAAQTVQLTTLSSSATSFQLRADAPWIQLSTTSGTVSSGSPALVSVAVNLPPLTRPGQYTSTVTILSGAADPQYIDVTATVSVNQSNVVASIAPNPVTQNAGSWSFTVQLAETGGAATRVTSLKIDGTDYSSAIKSWFGTDHIDANDSIQAPLQTSGVFPTGTQYFEFWGVDDVSGQQWYRVATVMFR